MKPPSLTATACTRETRLLLVPPTCRYCPEFDAGTVECFVYEEFQFPCRAMAQKRASEARDIYPISEEHRKGLVP